MILQARSVSKSFELGNKSISVLKEVSLQIDEHESISIMGRSGSGKSTLLSLFAGLDTPSQGEILIEGRTWTAMNEEEAAKARTATIGLIFQQFHLLPHLTAFENIALPLELQSSKLPIKNSVTDLLGKVGLLERAQHYPHELSRGECQRVAIARALILKPKLLLADEPTASLDDETSQDIAQLLLSLPENFGTSILIATHDRDLAIRCKRRYRISMGHLGVLE